MVGVVYTNLVKLSSLLFGLSTKKINDYANLIEQYKLKQATNQSNDYDVVVDTTRKSPLVSVVTPAFNSSKFLPSLLESLRRQSLLPDLQWVVVDDASTDGTVVLLTELARNYKDMSFKVIKNKVNGGASYALSKGFEAADGKYIAWVSADDEYHDPRKLEKDVCLLEKSADVVFSRFTLIKYKSGGTKVVESFIPEDNLELFLYLTFVSNLNGSSLVIKKEPYVEAGGFDVALWNVDGDYDLFSKLALLGFKFQLSDSTVLRRVHGAQTSFQLSRMKLGTSLTRSRFARISGLKNVMVEKLRNLRSLRDCFNLASNFTFFFLEISEGQILTLKQRILRSLLKPNSEDIRRFLMIYSDFVDYMFKVESFQRFFKCCRWFERSTN